VISRSYTKRSVKNGKRRCSSRPRSDKITTRGYRALTSTECKTIMIAELAVISGLGSSLD
jgi:hypothetical protein